MSGDFLNKKNGAMRFFKLKEVCHDIWYFLKLNVCHDFCYKEVWNEICYITKVSHDIYYKEVSHEICYKEVLRMLCDLALWKVCHAFCYI